MGDMDVLLPVIFWVFLILVVLVPPLLYLRGVRKAEKYQREPWRPLLGTFAAGAVVAVFIAIILSMILFSFYKEVVRVYEIVEDSYTLETLVLVCVIAPIVEEAAKGWVVWRRRSRFIEVEDGLVYGSAAGLGFAATENLFYGLAAYIVFGAAGFITIVLVRSISAVFLHASATAFMGYGFSRSKLLGSSPIPFFFGAVLLHSAYNFLASLGVVFGEKYGIISLVVVILLGMVSFSFTKKKIRVLDRSGARR